MMMFGALFIFNDAKQRLDGVFGSGDLPTQTHSGVLCFKKDAL